MVIDCWEVGGLLAVDVALEGLDELGCCVRDWEVVSASIRGEWYCA